MSRGVMFDGGLVSLTVILACVHDVWQWMGGLPSIALWLSCILTVARIGDTAMGKSTWQKIKRKFKRKKS